MPGAKGVDHVHVDPLLVLQIWQICPCVHLQTSSGLAQLALSDTLSPSKYLAASKPHHPASQTVTFHRLGMPK